MTHAPDKVATMAINTKTDRSTEVTQSLSTLVDERLRLKAELDELTDRLKAFDEVVIACFQSGGITKVETDNGKLSLIQSNTVQWNDEVLKGLITTAQWNRITVRKIDKVRLEAELVVGRIDADEVEVAKSVKQSKPFLR